jgi:putative redox protein
MSIVIQHLDEVRFSAHNGMHSINIDLPESHGGGNSGMSPPQLFVAALGASVGVYVADYCDSRAIAYQGMRLCLDWKYREKPRRIGSVCVRLEIPIGSLSSDDERGIQDSVQNCLLHNTLAQKPEFTVEVVPTGMDVPVGALIGAGTITSTISGSVGLK